MTQAPHQQVVNMQNVCIYSHIVWGDLVVIIKITTFKKEVNIIWCVNAQSRFMYIIF